MKKNRHGRILSLIRENVVTTQDQLLELLCEEGYDVTQATVSRDIKELRLVKATDSNGNYRYKALGGDSVPPKFEGIFSGAVISVVPAVNDVVVKCYSGTANAACAAIDNIGYPEIIGTLAGDDTIFIITKSEQDAKSLAKKLGELKY